MNNGKNPDVASEILSWVLIALCFSFFWPLGLVMLFKKLSGGNAKKNQKAVPPLNSAAAANTAQNNTAEKKTEAKDESFGQRMMRTPSATAKTATWLKIIGIIIMVIGMSSAYDTLDMVFWLGSIQYYGMELATNLAWIAAGAVMLGNGQRITIRQRRFVKYSAIIGTADAMDIDYIVKTSGYSRKKVEKDLQRMIENGIFGESAYLDMGLGYFFRSNAAAVGKADTDKKTADSAAAAPAPTPETEQGYSGILRNIRRANDKIADPVLSEKIERLEEITGKIFKIVEQDKDKERRIGTFLNYYLPTTQKLLDAYAEFEATGVDGENMRQAKEKIERTMDSIVKGFEHQLDMLYEADAMDVSSDIDVMQNMLKRDGASSDFDINTSAAPAEKKSGKTAEKKAEAPKQMVMNSDGTMVEEEKE